MTALTVTFESSVPTLPDRFWAREQLTEQLERRGVHVGAGAGMRVVVAAPEDPVVAGLVARWRDEHGLELAATAGAFAVCAGDDGASLLVSAGDEQGYGYAFLELADVVQYAGDVREALLGIREHVERPRNSVRAITRPFTAEAVDRAWFHDRAFWPQYLTELAVSRINEFSLALGAGNDYLIDRRVEDNYLYFPYPFLIDVGGYDVRVEGLSSEERSLNLDTLRFIGQEATRRGIAFGLGLWNHSYRFDPEADTERWPVRGIGPDNHAEYCRDALAALLRACPDVVRLTLRSHFEGGVPEPTHEFWRIVLGELPNVGRPVELDLHIKGVGPELREIVAKLGVPVRLSTKYWAEHQALPYHQSSIRENERLGGRRAAQRERDAAQPKPWLPGTGHPDKGTTGTEVTSKRSFTRYSFGDYAYDGREWPMVHRVWPGTQRVLLWGDPVLAAAYGRHASFAGAEGIEWFEPLAFLGKKDSATVGCPDEPRTTRALYTDAGLQASVDDWRKFRYTYRLLGRAGYDPETPVAELTRAHRAALGPAAEPALRALALASRVLPLTVATHAPSTACNVYWPEIPTPVPVTGRTPPAVNPLAARGWPVSSDFDMRPPYSFGNVSALDPELFSNAVELAQEVVAGRPSGRENPLDVAARMDTLADAVLDALAEAAEAAPAGHPPELTVILTDAAVLAYLARYYGAAQRAAVGYELRSLGAAMLEWAVEQQRAALAAWDEICRAAEEGSYMIDLPFGQTDYSRGSWPDRRPFLEDDLRALQTALVEADVAQEGAIGPEELERRCRRTPAPAGEHKPPAALVPGTPSPIEWRSDDPRVTGVTLRWRPVNQALPYASVDLRRDGQRWSGEIPAQGPEASFPVQYHFRVHGEAEAWAFPGLSQDLTNQPYFVVHTDPSITWGR